jgi:hypothetical protein
MNRYTFLFLLLVSLMACQSPKQKSVKAVKFTSRTIHIDYDTTITSIAWYNDFLLARQKNGRLIILDSNYQRMPDLEKRFMGITVQSVATLHDTTFVVAGYKSYYLDSGFNMKDYVWRKEMYTLPIYEDSTWYALECCMGEWGGAIFFEEKRTKKTWSYPATCAAQVIRLRNAYWVCENLAHLGKRTDYTLIPDIKGTYELKEDSLKFICNWWVTVDSLKNFWELPKRNGIKRILGPDNSMTALNFVYDDSLYTIVANDTATHINVLRNDSMAIQDTLFRHPLNFHELTTKTIPSGSATLLRLTSGSPVAAYQIRGNSSAILLRKGTNIDLLLKKTLK